MRFNAQAELAAIRRGKLDPPKPKVGPELPDIVFTKNKIICYRFSERTIHQRAKLFKSKGEYGKVAYHYLQAIRMARRRAGPCYIYLCPNGGHHWHLSRRPSESQDQAAQGGE